MREGEKCVARSSLMLNSVKNLIFKAREQRPLYSFLIFLDSHGKIAHHEEVSELVLQHVTLDFITR